MSIQSDQRKAVIESMLPAGIDKLLDVGCGPIDEHYRYARSARSVTCVDWNLRTIGDIPANIECVDGDFLESDLPLGAFDAIIAADVFEHIKLEDEAPFVQRCIELLSDRGVVVVSVPHRGTFSYLDPYSIKPTVRRWLQKLRLYSGQHDGTCDIRKGHKHYRTRELAADFAPLRPTATRYWGYLYDPILSWATSIEMRTRWLPARRFLEGEFHRELQQDYDTRSFNMAMRFELPTEDAECR